MTKIKIEHKTCGWQKKDKNKCGMPAKYELGYHDEDKIPICSLHQSRASTLGWPTNKIKI